MEDDSSNNNNIWSSHFFFSKQCIDLEAHRKTLDDNAIQNSQLQQASDDTIAIINNFFESHLFVFLDIRSQAHAMLGHYDAAYADVKKMIQCAPNSAVGYLKKGNILSISERYRRAIKAYSKGIKKITMATTEASDGKNQREKEKQEEIRQLLVAKRNEATMMNTISIDFLSIFPNEINDIIISQLSQRRRLTCLTVSRFWRRTILESASGWKKLSFHKHSMDGCPWLLNIIPLIGRFVKKLTFGNTDEQTLLRCFELITQGHFSKIQQLQITANSTRNLHPLSVNNTVLTAFSRMNVSLTYLNLNIGINKESITLASIIQLCKNLTHIRFSNGTDLRDVIGDFTHAEQQNALIDLELESAFITGRDIRTLLQKCRCIRRLIMLGCTTSVLKTINNYALNLEILGYNPSFAVPELNEKKENREKINGNELYSYYIDKNSNTNGITHHDVQNPTGKRKGLRMLYGNDGGSCIPTLSIFPLIYNNRETLEVIYATLSDLPQDKIHQLTTNYPDFQLTRATHIAFWLFPSIQSFLLRSIRYSTVLRHLHVTNVHNLEALTQILMEIPPLCELSISHVHQNSINSYNNHHTGRADENDIDGTVDVRSERIRITPMTTNNDAENNHLASLIRLFEKYGEISKMGFVSLESIKLRYWDVVDPILIILADIKTLRTITLEGLLHVTIQGLLNLIKSFAEQNGEGRQHLSTIKLDRIKAVSDDVIIALKDIKSIRTIELDRLASITDKGIKGLVDNPNPHLLSNLKVRRCTHITKGCLRYIKQKIK